MWQTETDMRARCRELDSRYSQRAALDAVQAPSLATVAQRTRSKISDALRTIGPLDKSLSRIWATLARQPATRG